MIIPSYTNTNLSRDLIHKTILEKKNVNSNYKVVDVGGSHSGWTHKFVDSIVDIQSTRPQDFKFNISNWWEWNSILDYVNKNGKFDFAICTHTLEDISHPATVLKNLSNIAKEGIITTPNIAIELSTVESYDYVGFIHHRYLFEFDDNHIFFAPKLPIINSLAKSYDLKTNNNEIMFQWQNQIEYKLFMNDYLGPNVEAVIQEYRKFLESGLSKLFRYSIMAL